jgi:hypothetical protein
MSPDVFFILHHGTNTHASAAQLLNIFILYSFPSGKLNYDDLDAMEKTMTERVEWATLLDY